MNVSDVKNWEEMISSLHDERLGRFWLNQFKFYVDTETCNQLTSITCSVLLLIILPLSK